MKTDNYIKRIILGLGGTSAILKSISSIGEMPTNIWPQIGIWILMVGGIAAFANWLYSEFQVDTALRGHGKLSDIDIELHQKLIDLFDDNLLSFLKNQDMAASFRNSTLDPLFEFVHKWCNSKYRYTSTALNQKLEDLLDVSSRFNEAVAILTFPEGDSEFSRIHVPIGELTEKFHTDGKKLNDLADATFSAFEDLQKRYLILSRTIN